MLVKSDKILANSALFNKNEIQFGNERMRFIMRKNEQKKIVLHEIPGIEKHEFSAMCQ